MRQLEPVFFSELDFPTLAAWEDMSVKPLRAAELGHLI